MKGYIKEQAIARGYPYKIFRGVAVPKSEADASAEECAILIEETHQLAAELNIILVEE